MLTPAQRRQNEAALSCLQDLLTAIETNVVRATHVSQTKDTRVSGSHNAPQYASTGVGSLRIEYINDVVAEVSRYVPEPGAYDEDLPDTDAEPVDHMARLKAEELAKVVKTLRDHAAKLEDGTLTLDGFSLVKPAELVESDAGLVRTFAGTGNLALAYHDASARAAHLAHAEVVVD